MHRQNVKVKNIFLYPLLARVAFAIRVPRRQSYWRMDEVILQLTRSHLPISGSISASGVGEASIVAAGYAKLVSPRSKDKVFPS